MAGRIVEAGSPWRVAAAVKLVVHLLTAVAALLSGPAASSAERWEPVTRAELAGGPPAFDATAGAEALFWKVWVEDEYESGDFRAIRRHYLRVKIHTAQAAQEWSQREIRFPAGNARVLDVVARTIQPDGSIAEMESRAVAKAVLVRYRGERLQGVRFAPPNVRPGCIVEYRYREIHLDAAAHYEEFRLEMDLPARRIVYHLRPLQIPGFAQRQMTFRARLVAPGRTDKDGYGIVEVADVPAFRREPHMPPEGQVKSWMLLFYTQEKLTTPAAFWRKTGIEQAKEFDRACKPDAELRRIAATLAAGAGSDEDKLRRIAEWCRREIRVVTSFAPESLRAHGVDLDFDARRTLAKRAGTPRGFDLLFGALARAAGLDVRFARVPSRKRFFFDQEMMDLRFVNSFQIAVRVGGGWRCYDPAVSWLPWDMVLWDEEAQWALLCDADSTRFIETPVAEPVRSSRVRHADLVLEENGDLAGTVRVALSGHWNERLREALAEDADSMASFREIMDWDKDGIGTEGLRILPVADATDSCRAEVQVRLRGHATSAGSRLLFEPSAWWARAGATFTESSRRWPVAFWHGWADRDSLRIRVPAGWRLEELPAIRPLESEGVAWFTASVRSSDEGRVVEYTRAFELGFGGTLYFPPSSYRDVKLLFDTIHDRDRTSLSLLREGSGP